MDTEKITINLGMVELGKIDLLTEHGIYSNRSDFIRSAVRAQLAAHDSDIKGYMKPPIPEDGEQMNSRRRNSFTIGVHGLTRASLEQLAETGVKLSVTVVGVLSVEEAIDGKLFLETVESVKVYGKVSAGAEIKKIIERMGKEQ